MIGTLINVATVLVGGAAGCLLGERLPARQRETTLIGLGILTILIGTKMFFESENVLIVLVSIMAGSIIGEALRIEEGLQKFGNWVEKRFNLAGVQNQQSRFIRGLLSSSLLFCVGPMTILGSIQDGLTGDYTLLAIKAALDGFAALALASNLGVGVIFSIFVILFYQGGLSCFAAQFEAIITKAMIGELSGAGGVILVAIAISSLLEIRQIRSGNMLPALIIAPALVALLDLFGF